LARATADPDVAAPAAVAGALEDLLGRFVSVYGASAGEEAFLREQIERVRRSTSPFPVVLQHGDPGPWNLLAIPGDGVAFLDWEAAEEPGPPLWDLFYFLRSFVVQSSRRRRVRNRLRAASDDLLAITPVTRAAAGWVAAYRTAVGVPAELVEPLFHCCWMHRAVKEATRIGPGRRGHYAELSGLLVDRRAEPGLRLLLTGDDHG
jgi:aminoglycoside phosphotransferase (APT) family kinase protein